MHRAPAIHSRVIDRALQPLSRVRPGEGVLAALLLVGCFLLLTSYYVLKTAREGLVLSKGAFGLRGDELKVYATGAMAVLLLGLVPAYGLLANRVRRIVLIDVTVAIVLVCLAVFFVLGHAGLPIGLAFFIWLGLVSLLLIAQFWSYANDLYTEEQGKRLFAIIAIGGSLGAIGGPQLAKRADSFTLMLLAGVILIVYAALIHVVERRDAVRSPRPIRREPIAGSNGFALLARERFLLLIAALLVVINIVNTTGEYILSNVVREHAIASVPAAAHAELFGAAREAAIDADRRELIKAFYGDFFTWMNILAFLIQAFVVSRVIDKLGIRRSLLVLPLVVIGAYGAIGAAGALFLIRAGKIMENGTNYSLQNTVHQTLFLRVPRVAKYKAKAAIDTFSVRAGDLCAAVIVAFAIHQLGFGRRALALLNLVVICALWIPICIGIARRHVQLGAEPPAA